MSKRDYKSYNVLGEELDQEGTYEDSGCTQTQDGEREFANEVKSKQENIPNWNVSEISQDTVGVVEIEKEQEGLGDEVILQPKKRINLGKKLTKRKESKEKRHQSSTVNNLEVDYISRENTKTKESNKIIDTKDNIDKSKDEAKAVNKNIDNRIGIGNKIGKGKNIKNISTGEIQEEVDMTFSGYKNYYQTKERSKFVKWSLRLAKFVLTMMLLPLIAIIAGTIVLVVGGFLTAVVICVGTGVVILGTICFMSTQVNASLVALGISVSVTAISFGGILFVLFYMLMKWSIGLLKKYKKPGKQSIRKEER